MTQDQIEAERVRFEAWVTASYGPSFVIHRDLIGFYQLEFTHTVWVGWLARAEEQYAERGHDAE